MAETSDVSKNFRYYVYLLYSLRDRGLYIGFTTNLKARLTEHAHGRVAATKNRTPLKLLFYEYFVNQHDAKSREEFLKSGFGRKQLAKALQHTLISLNS